MIFARIEREGSAVDKIAGLDNCAAVPDKIKTLLKRRAGSHHVDDHIRSDMVERIVADKTPALRRIGHIGIIENDHVGAESLRMEPNLVQMPAVNISLRLSPKRWKAPH